MQVMREKNKKQGGLIQQVTSIGGQRGVPLFSVCEHPFHLTLLHFLSLTGLFFWKTAPRSGPSRASRRPSRRR